MDMDFLGGVYRQGMYSSPARRDGGGAKAHRARLTCTSRLLTAHHPAPTQHGHLTPWKCDEKPHTRFLPPRPDAGDVQLRPDGRGVTDPSVQQMNAAASRGDLPQANAMIDRSSRTNPNSGQGHYVKAELGGGKDAATAK